jgi:hypothetical protein
MFSPTILLAVVIKVIRDRRTELESILASQTGLIEVATVDYTSLDDVPVGTPPPDHITLHGYGYAKLDFSSR